MTALLIVLIVLMIAAAVVVLEIRERLSAIAAMGALGFLVAVAFVLLGAPDVAKTQILVEIVALILLLRVTAGEPRDAPVVTYEGSGGIGGRVLASLATLAVIGAGGFAFAAHLGLGESVPARFLDSPSQFYLEHALSETGAANVVSAVLLDFRAYDTLGEATVLFCAVIGTLVVLRPRSADRTGEEEQP